MRRYFLLALLPVALGLPFIGRAYFVDDHYHMLMARGILEHPDRPYDFLADDDGEGNAGWEKGQPPRMVNPPLHHYVMAGFWKISGGRLWVVRLGALLLAGLTALFIGLLAQRLWIAPDWTVLLCIFSPAFWLSSYGLLIDSTMLLFFLAALWFWIDGIDRASMARLFLAGLLMGAAILTKYTGGFILALAAAWWYLLPPEQRRGRHLAFLLIPLVILVHWSWWNFESYGGAHIIEASRRVKKPFQAAQLLVALTFFSGVFISPLASWIWGWKWSARRTLGAALGAFIFARILMTPLGGFQWGSAALMSVFVVGTLLFLADLGGAAAGLRRPADKFLFLWLIVGFAQMIFLVGWVAARYYLVILPPAVFLLYRFLESKFPFSRARLNRALGATAAAVFIAGGALAWADYRQAECSRWIVRDTAADALLASGRRCYYLGDSFTGSYLKYAGWRPAFPNTVFEPGDLILKQEVTMPPWWYRADPENERLVKAYSFDSLWPVRVMDNRGGAGFYASVWGSLPWVFSRRPLERYRLFESLRPHAARRVSE